LLAFFILLKTIQGQKRPVVSGHIARTIIEF